MKNAVEMKNISYSYSSISGENKVLENINFSLEYGKITLIAGGSGTGKSTLFYIMNGVIPNNYSGSLSGEVFVCGENTKGKSIGEISRKIASVFQNAEEQIIQKYVEDEIAFSLENLGKSQEKTKESIDFYTNLLNLNKQDITLSLSGGQKQRLVTASALALENDIIILDEPLANLDKKSANILMQTLSKLKEQGKAICIIEHRLDMVIDYADIVYNLENSKLFIEENKEKFLSKHITKLDDICPKFNGTEALLDIKDIAYKNIINNINLTINKGERLLILGDNGSGKTTATKIIARLLKQSSGDIFQNIDKKLGTKKASKKWFKKLSYVFQNPNYQLFMPTVEDELLFACHSTEYAQKICDMFGLDPLLDCHPHALSQGQKRKVSVATMLAVKPEVIILDEPTVGQDYESLKTLVNNINTIHTEEKNTVITITHDIRCAEALCDKAIVIENGKIVKIGGKELTKKYLSNKIN
ncbi:MAG: ATP-binding cassette domain-containing protein [Clostridia bacterium]